MQINNNFNRYSAPQFGMALKIKPGAEKFLKTQGTETLERLEKIGKKMENYKHFDLEVNEHGYAIRLKEDAEYLRPKYFQEGTINRNPAKPNENGSFNYTDIDFDENEASTFYKKFRNSDILDKKVLVTDTLEATYNRANPDNTDQNVLAKLMNKFGTKD